MKLVILSDIHDNVWKLAPALAAIGSADALICCGDLCSPFIVHQMGRGFAKPIHVVFGNNDADLFRITANAHRYEHIRLHGEFFQGEFGGKRVAVNHYDNIARAIAASGAFDLVCYGHNHVYDVQRTGRTLAINPGSIMGATFAADGSRTDVASTYVIYDTEADETASFQITRNCEILPYQPPAQANTR
ncbi:MAG TPA: metallophosphoesterase family protein [Bryobacteraceae bacterium]|nr:metallophosphoesterase family protein [Bryobacteraceae bacterium]